MQLRPTASTPAMPQPTVKPAATRRDEAAPAIARDGFTRQAVAPAERDAAERASAVEASRRILASQRFDAEAGQNVPTRRIVRDAIDSSAWVWGRNKQAAKKQIEANQALVNRRLDTLEAEGKLTPAERAQYQAVAKMVGQVAPAATLALQLLVLGSPAKIPGGRPNHEGKDLLAALHQLTKPGFKLAPGIDRHQLVRHLVREIAEPASINQRSYGTCATTSLQMVVAMTDPAEFVRVVGGLASAKGEVTLRNHQAIKRVKGTERAVPLEEKVDGQVYQTPDERSISTRLFSAAFMDLGNGEVTYDNRTDGHIETGMTGGGLMDDEVRSVVAGATGSDVEMVVPEEAPFTAESPAMERLREATAAGTPISVGMEWGEPDENGVIHGGHEVIVTAVEGDTVHILNPWGTEETIGLEAFAARVGALHFPAGT